MTELGKKEASLLFFGQYSYIIAYETGKAIDYIYIMVMSKHCTGCNHCDKLSDEYKNGRVTTCDATFSGSSGAMEPQVLFKRSLDYNI